MKIKVYTHKNHIIILPILLIVSLLPTIVQLYSYDSNLKHFAWAPDNTISTDLYLYYKSLFFQLICLSAMIIILYKFIKNKKILKWNNQFVLLFGYGVLSFLSSVCSVNSFYSFNGISNQFESIWVLLGYCIITYYAYLCINNENDVLVVLRWWVMGTIIIVLIGLSQLFKHNFYHTDIGQSLIALGKSITLTSNLEEGRVSSSLYNPNYVGTFAAIAMPILIALFFTVKNIPKKVAIALISIGTALCLLGSQSRGGVLALIATLFLFLILLHKIIIKHWKSLLITSFIIIFCTLLYNHFDNNALFSRITNIFKLEPTNKIINIFEKNDSLSITYNQSTFYAKFDNNCTNLTLYDTNNNKISTTYDENTFTYQLHDSKFKDITFTKYIFDENTSGFGINFNGLTWYFTNDIADNSYKIYNDLNKLDNINKIPTALPEKLDTFASKRGFIWSRTLPLLKDNILLGSGADTFTVVYPQNDYFGKYYNGYHNTLITKPHNMYLQIAVQTGVLSLILMLIFYVMYFIQSLRLYWKNDFTSNLGKLGLGIFLATFGYMMQGIVNDSTITYTPIFWILLGIGISINELLKKVYRSIDKI